MELGIECVQVIRRQAIRQKLIDIIVGKMALLAGHLEQGFDCFGQVRCLGMRASMAVAAIAGVEDLALRSAAGSKAVIAGFLGWRFLAVSGLGSKDERVAGPLRLARGRSFPAAALFLCSVIQFAFLHWQNSAIDRGYPMDYVRFHRLAFGTKPFAGLVQTNDS
jgi:hypothetical protein